MALTLTLDYSGLRVLTEPGFWQFTSTGKLIQGAYPADQAAHQALFWDDKTKTVMLRPLQLDPGFLNHAPQLDSILRYDQLVVNSADASALKIHEQATFNNDNPYIWHVPIGPTSGFPTGSGMSGGGFPESFGNSLTGYTSTTDLSTVELTNIHNNTWYAPSTAVPTDPPPAPTTAGGFASAVFPARSAVRFPANAGFLFRWWHPADSTYYAALYGFLVGQYLLVIKHVMVQVWRDDSAHGDRTHWKKITQFPLFSVNPAANAGPAHPFEQGNLAGIESQDRALMFLPFRRHQILLYASSGASGIIQTAPFPTRLPDNSDWNITRSDTIEVVALTPTYGRFQIQRLKYPSGTINYQAPPFTLDYLPTAPPVITITKDSDHGTSIASTLSQPAAYQIPVNDATKCPPITDDPNNTNQSRTYGVQLAFQASSDQRWTPFFYGYLANAPPVFNNQPKTPHDVTDTTPIGQVNGASLERIEFVNGERSGEARGTFEILDYSSYPLAAYYNRTSIPLQLKTDATIVFTGLAQPIEETPLRLDIGQPRKLTIPARDRWQQLVDSNLRDQTDWTGFGHMTVVNSILAQAGYDTSAQPPDMPPFTPQYNTPLLALDISVSELSGDVVPGWRPRVDDTAASYILRLATLFSGWICGFHASGQFFYQPRESSPGVAYLPTVVETFYESKAAAVAAGHSTAPLYRSPVTFTTLEPESNAVQVYAGHGATGQMQGSTLYVDWASLKNPNVVNYLGKWKREVVVVGGIFSCEAINYIARRIWDLARRRWINLRFQADYSANVMINRVIRINGYAGDWRVIGYSAQWERTGFHGMEIEAQKVEKGFGTP